MQWMLVTNLLVWLKKIQKFSVTIKLRIFQRIGHEVLICIEYQAYGTRGQYENIYWIQV